MDPRAPERPQTHDAAFDEREYLQSILEAEPACVKVVRRDGTLAAMNPAGLAMIQAESLEEAQRRPLVDVVAPSHRDAFLGLHERVIAGDAGSLEYELVGLRGRHLWVETQAVPLRGARGGITAVLGVTRDITEARSREQALRESERRYQSLSDVAPVGIFRTDAAGATTYVNAQWCHLAGITADEAKGDGWLRALHGDDRARIQDTWARAWSARRASSAYYRLVRPDGTVLTVLGQSVPEWNSEGTFLGYIGTITDVTARDRAEALLESQRGLLEMIAAGAPIEATLTSLLTFVEAEAPGIIASILLLDDDDMHVTHLAAPHLPRAFIAAIDGTAIGPAAGSCGTALYRGEPVISEDIATDPLWIGFRDAALAAGLRACWSTPILDRRGRRLGSFALYFREPRRPVEQHRRLVDVATNVAALAIARHKEEAALAASEERFRATFEHAAVGVAHLRLDGRLLRANPTLVRMTGYSAEELRALAPGGLIHTDDRTGYGGLYARLLSGALNDFTLETRFLHKQADPIWVNLTVSMVRTREGEPEYGILVAEDVTARRGLELQLRRSQQLEAVGLLAGGVAHDFNNVLSIILGLSEMARDELSGRPLGDDMQTIVDAATRGAEITRQLLAFARREASHPIVLDVRDSLDGLMPLLSRVVGEAITLTVVNAPAPCLVKIDPTQFDRALINLVTNAREAIDGPGAIRIESTEVVVGPGDRTAPAEIAPGPFVVVRVTDTGVGMDVDRQERIFTPFFTTKTQGTGTGLGLSVVHGICQQAGGSIVCRSAPGAGTTFSIYLPRCDEAVSRPAPAIGRAAGTGHETVLVVEDEPALLNLARRTLEAQGYRVLAASSPADGLALASQHRGELALLLTDVVMPQMSGTQLARRVTELCPAVRVLYMSGYPADALGDAADPGSPVGYIQKPFTRTVLTQSVRSALDL